MREIVFKELSDKVVGLGMAVHRGLGPGLLESAYEGAYIADIVIDNRIIVELKSVSQLTHLMEAQLINYLKLSGIQVGYLMNFNSLSLVYRRFVCTQDRCW